MTCYDMIIYMCVCICVYIYICAYINMYMYIYLYTHMWKPHIVSVFYSIDFIVWFLVQQLLVFVYLCLFHLLGT